MVRMLPAVRNQKSGVAFCRNKLMNIVFVLSFAITVVHIGRGILSMSGQSVEDLFPWVDQPTVLFQNIGYRPNHQDVTTRQSDSGIVERKVEAAVNITYSILAVDNGAYRHNESLWAVVTPPGFLGGYRNQVIRMFGLVIGAKKHNINQILLPSILWSTTTSEASLRPVPMEDLFDIDHWNTFQPFLPRLVSEVPDGDCWSSSSIAVGENQNLTNKLRHQKDAALLERVLQTPRFLTPIANISLAYSTGELKVNPRKFDVSDQVKHCQHPLPYGAGGGRGQLWVNYMEYSRKRQRKRPTGLVKPDVLERSFLQALKPLPKWANLARQCVVTGARLPNSNAEISIDNNMPSYIALHPRIELEMMVHSCGAHMNKNLTRILDDVVDFLSRDNTQQDFAKNISGIFVAFSREGASVTAGREYRRFQAFVDENIQTMNRVLGSENGLFAAQGLSVPSTTGGPVQHLPVFECGDQLLRQYYEAQQSKEQPTIDYGSILSSIINFQVAVEAKVFVGMRYSSWSNSVWTTRYYTMGEGKNNNFEYTRERGIQPVENGGLPPPHQNCDGIKDSG